MINDQEIIELIGRIAQGDYRAQDKLFESSYRYFYQVAISVVKNNSDAEDIVAEFFNNICYISQKSIISKNKKAYLAATVKNLAKNFIRKNKKYKLCENEGEMPFEQKYNDNFFDCHLHEIMEKHLTKDEENVIVYLTYYEYTYRETAKLMKITLGKVQRLASSGYKKLKKYLP